MTARDRALRGLLLLAVLAAGCDVPGKPKPSARFERPEAVLGFAKLFRINCAGCHGADGRLGAGPPLNDELFRAIVPVGEIESVLNKGRHGTLMPAFAAKNGGTLTEAQVQVLVHEIKGIAYRVEIGEGGPARAKVVADPAGTAPAWGVPKPAAGAPPYLGSGGDWRAGLVVFRAACAGCHGEQGQGLEKDGPRALRINDRALLALTSDRVLRRYVITGRPDLKMPDYRGRAGRGDHFAPLTDRQVTDVAALLAHWRISSK